MNTPSLPLPAPAARPRPRAQRAFTLVEVMLASFVMVFAISTALITMQHGFKAIDTARKTTLASQIMQSEMERLRMLSWAEVLNLQNPAPTQAVVFTDIFPNGTAAERAILTQLTNTFTPTRTVALLTDKGSEVMQITVTVGWTGLDGVARRRSSTTHYAKDGLYSYYYRVPTSS